MAIIGNREPMAEHDLDTWSRAVMPNMTEH